LPPENLSLFGSLDSAGAVEAGTLGLGHQRAILQADPHQGERPRFATRDALGVATFLARDSNTSTFPGLERALAGLFLPADSPLSVLAVELLPGSHVADPLGPSSASSASSAPRR
jgi:hypothetical protein